MADHKAGSGVLSLPTRTYDFAKKVAQIYLPALGTLYVALAQIWHLPNQIEVMATVTAVDLFLGAILGLSSASYNASDKSKDGVLEVAPATNDVTNLNLSGATAQELADKGVVTLKVTQTDSQ